MKKKPETEQQDPRTTDIQTDNETCGGKNINCSIINTWLNACDNGCNQAL